jgi:hypothetical protein
MNDNIIKGGIAAIIFAGVLGIGASAVWHVAGKPAQEAQIVEQWNKDFCEGNDPRPEVLSDDALKAKYGAEWETAKKLRATAVDLWEARQTDIADAGLECD